MSTNAILVFLGAALFLVGLIKLGKGRAGGFTLSNFGITFGGSTTQKNEVGNVTPIAAGSSKPNWIGLATTALGFLTALTGMLKALLKD